MSDQHYICTAYYMASFMTQTMTLRKKVTFLFFFTYLFFLLYVEIPGKTDKDNKQNLFILAIKIHI